MARSWRCAIPRASVALLLWGGIAACAADPEVVTTRLQVRLPDDPACAPPGPVDRLEVRALGDFPTSDTTVAVLAPEELPGVVDRFPASATRMTVQAQAGGDWHAAGARVLPEGDLQGPVLLLPLGSVCAVDDPALHASPGSVALALPDGSIWIAGGLQDGLATRRMVRVPPGAQQAEPVGAGLQVTRTGATATWTDGVAVVVGGAQGTDGVAHDTFEVFDPAESSTAFGQARLSVPRRDHGACRLPDGRVLVVGGRSTGGGAPLASAEIVDPLNDAVVPVDGMLATARAEPRAHTLDDGTVVVAGGRDGAGDPVPGWEAFDGSTGGFVEVGCGFTGAGASVAVPGARLVRAAPDPSSDETTFTVVRHAGSLQFECVEVELDSPPPPLDALRAAPFPDGSILITGERVGEPVAFVVDVGRGTVRSVPARSVPTRLLPFASGAVAELGPQGAAFRRELLRTPFDNPPATLLAGSAEGVAFDAAPRWRRDAPGFAAVAPDARVDVPALRFGRVEVEVEADAAAGAVELLIVRDGRPPEAVPVPDDGVLRWSRTEGAGRIGIAIRAQPEAIVRALRITRLEG